MIEWIADKLSDVRQLILAVATVAAVLYVMSQWWRTKALIPTLTAMLVAGLVLWAIANIEWFKEKVGEETSAPHSIVTTVHGHHPPDTT